MTRMTNIIAASADRLDRLGPLVEDEPAKRVRTYYVLAVREDGRWAVQFGDYDPQIVKSELIDYLDHGFRAKDLRIVHTSPKQPDIQTIIDDLN